MSPMNAPSDTNLSCKALTSILFGVTPFCLANSAAVPTACPIAKQGPLTRSDAWPSGVVEAHRPATNKLSTPLGKVVP